MNIPIEISNRHPATLQVFQFFAYDHLPEYLQHVSQLSHDMAYDMIVTLPDGPELTFGLRKLLEAKDCFVRQAVAHGVNNNHPLRTQPQEQHAAHSDSEPRQWPAPTGDVDASQILQHPITNPNALEGGIGVV